VRFGGHPNAQLRFSFTKGCMWITTAVEASRAKLTGRTFDTILLVVINSPKIRVLWAVVSRENSIGLLC
jgi:hypothetical protein